MKDSQISSYVALVILACLIIIGTVISLVTNPINSLVRLLILSIIVFGASKFVKFADNYADKKMQQSRK